MKVSPGAPFDDMSIDNTYLAEGNIRCTASLKEYVRLANFKAEIKPNAPLSVFDKENSIEFPLDSVHYLYKQSNPNPVLLSRASL